MFNIPQSFTQGDRVTWFQGLAATYDPATDTLSCFIRGQSALDLTGVPTGLGWNFEITPIQSAALIAGKYQAQLVVYPVGGRKTLGTYNLTVCPSFENLTELDTRDEDEKELEDITKAIAQVASKGVAEYEIKGRKVTYQDLNALTNRQIYLRNRIAKKKNKNLIGGRNVPFEFSS